MRALPLRIGWPKMRELCPCTGSRTSANLYQVSNSFRAQEWRIRCYIRRSPQLWAGCLAIPFTLISGWLAPARGDDQGALSSVQNNAANKSELQTGFNAVGTFSSAMGQPEVKMAMDLLMNVLQFTGYFGDTDVVSAELALLQERISSLESQLTDIKNALGQLADTEAQTINRQMVYNVSEHHRQLTDLLQQLYPNPTATTFPRTAVSPQIAHQAAMAAAGIADQYIDSKASLWIGADVYIDQNQLPHILHNLKPYPALQTYLLSLQLFTIAMEIASGGTTIGYQDNIRNYGGTLRRLSFLRTRQEGGHDDDVNDPLPLPDKILLELKCGWQGNLIQLKGACSARGVCKNDIARTTVYSLRKSSGRNWIQVRYAKSCKVCRSPARTVSTRPMGPQPSLQWRMLLIEQRAPARLGNNLSARSVNYRLRLIPLAPVPQNAVTRAIPDVRTNSERTAFPEFCVMADFPTSPRLPTPFRR